MSPVTPRPNDDLVLLGRDPISPDALIRHVRQSHDGAVVTFDGCVRNHSHGRATLYLEYESYESMALEKMKEIAASLHTLFAIDSVAIAPLAGVMGGWKRHSRLRAGKGKDRHRRCHPRAAGRFRWLDRKHGIARCIQHAGPTIGLRPGRQRELQWLGRGVEHDEQRLTALGRWTEHVAEEAAVGKIPVGLDHLRSSRREP